MNHARMQRVVAAATSVPSSVHRVLSEPGERLEADVRRRFEPVFQRDLSHVRVHRDASAAASSARVNALAYSHGRHIVFGDGRYRPDTEAGARLIGHEVAHVLQSAGRGTVPPVHVGRADDAMEVEADRIADLTSHGVPAVPSSVATNSDIRRFAGPELPITPQQVAAFRALVQEVVALGRAGALAAEETALLSTTVAEAEGRSSWRKVRSPPRRPPSRQEKAR